MGDSMITIVVIGLAAILMFVFPLLAVSESSDNTSQLSVQNATTEFVENIRSTGKITLDDYDRFVRTINSTGNTYNVSMEVQILDENPGKKVIQSQQTVIGENVYYSEYTKQILQDIEDSERNAKILKEGDIVTITVSNSNQTIAQTLRNFFYRMAGNSSSSINASHTGVVSSNGNQTK